MVALELLLNENMKVPPTNNMNGFNAYEDEHYFNEGDLPHNANTNGNGNVGDYAPAPPVDDADFSEYMWMENEEEFDKEVLQRLEEEELMEQCMLHHMLDDDRPNNAAKKMFANQSIGGIGASLNNANNKVEQAEVAKSSTLNPHAAEFVPRSDRTPSSEPKSS